MNFKRTVRTGVILMGIFSAVAAMFTGCSKPKDNGVFSSAPTPQLFSEISPVPIPEGVKVTGLFITHQGMRAGRCYMLQATDDGVIMKISNELPDSHRMTKDEDISTISSNDKYFRFIDTVKDCEYASSVSLKDDAPLREIEGAIAENGVLAWDGYNQNDPMEGVLDSGDSYQLYLELSDGSTVTVNGYNACPAGFRPLLRTVQKVFEDNSDFSRYMAESLTDSPCVTLFALFKDGMRTEYRLELSKRDSRWVVVMNDPYGNILEKGTDIADYGDIESGLPFDRFISTLRRHNAERWNGYYAADAKSDSGFTLRLSFEDEKKYEVSGNVFPEGFEEFKTDFILEAYRFYSEVKGDVKP